VREATIENLSKRFDILDRQLGDQSYLTGETFTIADAYAYAILTWTKIHKIDMHRWPRLMALLDRVLRRDSRKYDQPKVPSLEVVSFAATTFWAPYFPSLVLSNESVRSNDLPHSLQGTSLLRLLGHSIKSLP